MTEGGGAPKKKESQGQPFWCQAGNMKVVSKLAKRNIQGICKYDCEYAFSTIVQPIF